MTTATEQAAPATEAPSVTTETEAKAPATTETQAPATEPKAFDPNTLPPEAKSYFEKQYEGYGKFKELASEYEGLLRSRDFQEWYQGLGTKKATPAPTSKFEISDEEFVSALSDKTKFSQLVSNLAEKIATEKLAPELEQTKNEVALAKRTAELEHTMKKFPDFMELDKRGLIEPVLKRYPNLGWEDAYWLAKRHTFNEEVDKKARGLVETKKTASVEKPGTSSGGRTNKVKVKTSLEAMEIAAEAHRHGREVPEIEFE